MNFVAVCAPSVFEYCCLLCDFVNRWALAPGLISLTMSPDTQPNVDGSMGMENPNLPSYQNSMDAGNVDRIAIIQILMRLVSILCSWFTDIPLVRKCEELHNLRR